MRNSNPKPNQLSLVCLIIVILLNLLNCFFTHKWPDIYILKSISLNLALLAVFSGFALSESFLAGRKQAEYVDNDILKHSLKSSDIFNQSSLSSPAASSYKLVICYIIPAMTAAAGLVFAGLNIYRLKSWVHHLTTPPVSSFNISGICFFMFFFCVLSGSYYNGLSRNQSHRWLRPIGSWLLYLSFLYALTIASAIIFHINSINPDYTIFRIISILNIIFGLELIGNVIIEIYRPKIQSLEVNPIFESRFLAFFTAPDGFLQNIANTIDYQFGIKISDTELNHFINRLVFPYVILVCLSLYFFECIVIIDSDEVGIIERAGKPIKESLLPPGMHFKFPRPIDRLINVPVKKIRKVIVGFNEPHQETEQETHKIHKADKNHTDKVILWNKRHHHSEETFLIASRLDTTRSHFKDASRGNGYRPTSANLIAAAIPVFYSVDESKIFDYVYNYKNQAELIKKIAYREIISYLASADFIHIIGKGRMEAKSDIEMRIRNAFATMKPAVGIKIHYVGIMEIHPPVTVAGAFQNLIGAKELSNTTILKSQKNAVITKRDAEIKSHALKSEAEGYLYEEQQLAKAEVQRFREQQKLFHISPKLYKLRTFLDLFETETEDVKKYVITSDSKETFIIDSQQRLSPDLLNDLNVEPAKEK